MPEAVASNSRAASASQPSAKVKRAALDGVPTYRADPPFAALSPYVQRDFAAVQEMLRSYAMMTNAVLDTGDDFSLYSAGMHLIHQLIMLRLDEVAEYARSEIQDKTRTRDLMDSDPDLRERIGMIVANVLSETGHDCEWDKMAEWSNATVTTWATLVSRYNRELRAELGSEGNIIDAGSLLPWLELKIRKDLGVSPQTGVAAAASPKDLRDQFIADKYREGRTPSEISQALSLRQSTVLRTIDRLTGRQEGGERKAG